MKGVGGGGGRSRDSVKGMGGGGGGGGGRRDKALFDRKKGPTVGTGSDVTLLSNF